MDDVSFGEGRSPLKNGFEKKLENYFSKVTPQTPCQ